MRKPHLKLRRAPRTAVQDTVGIFRLNETYQKLSSEESVEVVGTTAQDHPMDVDSPIFEYNTEIRQFGIVEVRLVWRGQSNRGGQRTSLGLDCEGPKHRYCSFSLLAWSVPTGVVEHLVEFGSVVELGSVVDVQ